MKHEGWSVAAGGIPDGTFTVARPSQRDNCHLPARHFRSLLVWRIKSLAMLRPKRDFGTP